MCAQKTNLRGEGDSQHRAHCQQLSTAQTASALQHCTLQHSCSRLQVGLAEQLLLRLLDQGACLQVRLCVAVTAFELSHHPPTATIRGLQGAHLLLAAADCVHPS